MMQSDIERAARFACPDATIAQQIADGVDVVLTMSNGRRVRVNADGGVAFVEVLTDEAFGILGSTPTIDRPAVLAMIKARTGAATDDEAIDRALAVVGYYLGAV